MQPTGASMQPTDNPTPTNPTPTTSSSTPAPTTKGQEEQPVHQEPGQEQGKLKDVWLYGKAIERIPVKVGDIWIVGNHVLACGDVQLGAGQELLQVINREPDVAFCDPPWNQAAAKGYRTKALQKMEGFSFVQFLDDLMGLLSMVRKDVFVEYGYWANNQQMFLEQMEKHAGRMLDDWIISYNVDDWECRLTHMAFNEEATQIEHEPGRYLRDEVAPEWCLSRTTQPGDTVFDPCMGVWGLTARAAHKLQLNAVGLELNPRRLACVIEWLWQQTGVQPRITGKLQTMQGVKGE